MLQNPDMLQNMVKMMRDPKNKAMLDMMQAQNPNMNTMLTVLDGITRLMGWYQALKRLWGNLVVRLLLFGLLVLWLARYFA
jgi:transposase